MKPARNLRFCESRKILPAALLGCVLVFSLTFITASKYYSFSIPNLKILLSVNPTSRNSSIGVTRGDVKLGNMNVTSRKLTCDRCKSVPSFVSMHLTQKGKYSASNLQRGDGSRWSSKTICDDSNPRSILCEMEGDVRIDGNTSSIVWVTSQRNESWKIKPYARMWDEDAMRKVRGISFRTSNPCNERLPRCTVSHTVPAIIFSAGGYTGNLFHDFTDVLIPLFLTSHEYHGKVQFLTTNMKPWWTRKHKRTLALLSHYDIINFDNDDRVHCFMHVIVGLKSHKELNIDPLMPPVGYSMAKFTEFMRTCYSLKRETVISIRELNSGKKPRLLIISRKKTRAFANIEEIAETARGLGYEAVVAEPGGSMNMTQFARIVNSCDVMMGVHGAGLTNMVFLPRNAVLVQIVPWGGLEWISWCEFGCPSTTAKIKYVQYEISVEESTLIEHYPREHPCIKSPLSIHKQGWDAVRDIYLGEQNVRLDLRRFRGVLLEALNQLREVT